MHITSKILSKRKGDETIANATNDRNLLQNQKL